MTLAIHIDDRALAIAADGRVLSSAPAAVFDGGDDTATGADAWQAIRRQPTSTATRHWGAIARQRAAGSGAGRPLSLITGELRRRLAELPDAEAADGPRRVCFVTPAHFEPAGLGAILGIAPGLGLAVDAFVDAATVSAAALGRERTVLVVEMGLHHLAVTAIESSRQARRRRAVVSDRGGLIELYEAWLDLISTAMVKRTRFDPLHDAAVEQQLFDRLPVLAREAAASGGTTAVVDSGADRFETPLSRDQFATAAEPLVREMLSLIHELRPAGTAVDVLVPRAIADLPGIRDALEGLIGCELFAHADGYAAAAASLLELDRQAAGDTVPLLRRLPARRQESLGPLLSRESLGIGRAQAPQPSHVLFDGRAFALGSDALVIGRAPGGAHAITLPEGLAGVSRRHCTLISDGGEIVLVDHSRFGTYVNGERVSERVRVHSGDRVRIGEPGAELALIAVGDPALDAARGPSA